MLRSMHQDARVRDRCFPNYFSRPSCLSEINTQISLSQLSIRFILREQDEVGKGKEGVGREVCVWGGDRSQTSFFFPYFLFKTGKVSQLKSQYILALSNGPKPPLSMYRPAANFKG